jgi:serine/threonine-protein kinase
VIAPGARLRHYEIAEKLGQGGMGVVWRARDTTLDREVAIKILPAEVAQNPERLARFENEARSLAALNHPNIATIHGLEEADGLRFLVMELVPGEDLAERVERGALPVKTALAVAVQLAEALEAAHEQGIIHRDLKPANVKIDDDDRIKVLDFGLAKAFDPGTSGSGGNPSMSPTLTSAGTAAGVILGTAAYMSPEQAKGKPVDRRADIWAFGVVLHEMLTGKPLYRGESVSETLAAVLMSEPDPATLPANTPPRVRRLLERCLRKDPQARLRDVGDARLVLEEALAGHEWEHVATAENAGRSGGLAPWVVAAVGVACIALGALLAWFAPGNRTDAAAPTRSVSIVTEVGDEPWPSIAPDGRRVAYRGRDGIYVRDLASYEERLLPGTAEVNTTFALSPDSRWLAYAVGNTVSKVLLDGSAPPVQLGEMPRSFPGLIWLVSGRLAAVSSRPFHVMTLPENGGAATEVPVAESPYGVNFFFAWNPLPDGRHLLAAADTFNADGWRMNVVVLDTETGESRLLVESAVASAWAPTGHLLFTRQGTLLAVPFDSDRLETTGGAVALREGLRYPSPIVSGLFSVSNDGTLVHRTGGGEFFQELVFVEADGSTRVWDTERRDYVRNIRVTADGARLAAQVGNWNEGLEEIWLTELDRPRLRPWIDVDGQDCGSPVWSRDGRTLYYTCGAGDETGGLYRRSLDGGPELLVERTSPASRFYPRSVSRDESFAILSHQGEEGGVYRLALGPEGATGEPVRLFHEGVNEFFGARLSPDGSLLCYFGNETGRDEVYLRPLRADGSVGAPMLVSTEGGAGCAWAPTAPGDPMRLYYGFRGGADAHAMVMEVDVDTRGGVKTSEPRPRLDRGELRANLVEPLPGGRFLITQREEEELERAVRIRITFNWFDELERRMAAAR